MKLLEGTSIAAEMKAALKKRLESMDHRPRLAIVIVGENPVSKKFVALKERFAGEIGVETRRYELAADLTTSQLRARMKDIVHEARNDRAVVQLPMPPDIDTQAVLNAVTPEKDVDVLSARSVGDFQVGKSKILPPVAGAVDELFKSYGIDIEGKHVVVLGYGRLVGQPLAIWFIQKKAFVTIIGDEKQFDQKIVSAADIVVSGMGQPNFIKGDMIREGAIVLDVGTSEVAGEMVGDVDFESVKNKAAYLTPIKGGVGPLTVALIFRNLLILNGILKS